MTPKESKISKQVAAGISRDIIFTFPETLEIIMKPQSATCQSNNMASYKMDCWPSMVKRNTRKKLPVRNSTL